MRLSLILFFFQFLTLSAVDYIVDFQGFTDNEVKESLLCNSTLKLLENEPPASMVALRRRAESDLPNIVDALHSLGYYNAQVGLDIDDYYDPVHVNILIDTGPVYPLLGFTVDFPIETSELGITLGCPAQTKTILEAESRLLQLLAARGYPLATIEKRRVVADQEKKGIFVTLSVNTGLQVVFGATEIFGLNTVDLEVINRRIAWCDGDPYDPELIAKTEFDLESLRLFSSITLLENESELKDNRLPIQIYLKEACQRTIGFGASYNTQLGLGGTFNWEHRNMRGLGERFKIKSDIWQRKQNGIVQYIIPDFKVRYQELRFLFEADKEITQGYDEFFYSGSVLIDRCAGPNLRFSYGGTYKQLFSSKSNNNRPSHLLKTPLYLRYTEIDSTFCPTQGYTLTLRCIPTFNISPQFTYAINLATLTGYYPVFGNDFLVLAGKVHFGSIFGSRTITIPPPERLYAGSQCLLRGYKYMTVSPLNREENKPLGGRSMLVYSFESRFKIDPFGWSLFYEVGNVFNGVLPQMFGKQLQSVGFGLHYYTHVGPLRLDVAFPLNPRKKIDKPFQFYISIGQAF